MFEGYDDGMNWVKGRKEDGRKFRSRDGMARQSIISRRRACVEGEYGAGLDEILAPVQTWEWFRPSKWGKAESMVALNGNVKIWKGMVRFDSSGPYPSLPRFGPNTSGRAFDDGHIFRAYTPDPAHAGLNTEPFITSIKWYIEDVKQVIGNLKIGERVTGIETGYRQYKAEGDPLLSSGLRGRVSRGSGAQNYEITLGGMDGLWVSRVYGAYASPGLGDGLEQLLFEVKDNKGVSKTGVGNSEYAFEQHHRDPNAAAKMRFFDTAVPRVSTTALGNTYGIFDPPRLM